MNSYHIRLAGHDYSITSEFLAKYDRVGPRYTSYPTVPEWRTDYTPDDWHLAVELSRFQDKPISVYIHIPFCKSACSYCACNFIVSDPARVEVKQAYLKALYTEISYVADGLRSNAKRKQIAQLHLGGGTPTFLTPAELVDLHQHLSCCFEFTEDAELGIEVDPRVTTHEHLQTLHKLGFNRISLGVQDFNERVQVAVNRIQSFDMVQETVTQCRQLGYLSINFDLIYGLPLQTVESFFDTVKQVIELRPDRIALFNYAHIPSLRPFQRAHIDTTLLPIPAQKFLIFCTALNAFCSAGYQYIGMDHFALQNDELTLSRSQRTLHRNFMGYSTKGGLDLFGFGVTAISSAGNNYAQNEKKLNRYQDSLRQPNLRLPIERGIKLNVEDVLRRDVISRLLCHGMVVFAEIELAYGLDFEKFFRSELSVLDSMQQDGLINIDHEKIQVSNLGSIFLRNIAMPFDSYLGKSKDQLFSRTV